MTTTLSATAAKYELRPFQQRFVERGVEVSDDWPNLLLGDDMGLGKTVEAIALDWEKRRKYKIGLGKTLIVAPHSVVDVWKEHYAWMIPHLKVTAYDPEGKQPAQARKDFLASLERGESSVYVIHWEALRLMPELAKRSWFHVVADEAHRAKNRKAQQTIALKRIRTQFKTACTGTPAETRPDDLWSILNWLYPKKYTSYWRFYNSYVDWKQSPQGYKVVTGVRNVRDLHEEIRPFYCRRMKTTVLKDLPEKTYTAIPVALTPQQRKRYDQMKNDMLTWVGEHEEEPLAAPAVIARLMRLQQFAISDCTIVDGLKTVTLKTQREVDVYNRHNKPEVPVKIGFRFKVPVKVVKMCEPSSKLDALMQIIEDNPDKSFIVFSQFKQVIDMFETRLVKKKITHALFTSATPKSERAKLIADFQAGKRRIFAGTIKTGGEGITLTRASTVIFIDRDWSPSKNVQAEDRAWRIGQVNAVQVIDLVAKGTVDRGRLQKIEQSWKWIKQMLGDQA